MQAGEGLLSVFVEVHIGTSLWQQLQNRLGAEWNCIKIDISRIIVQSQSNFNITGDDQAH